MCNGSSLHTRVTAARFCNLNICELLAARRSHLRNPARPIRALPTDEATVGVDF